MNPYALDLDHILSEEELVSCNFLYHSSALGFLDPSGALHEEDDLPANTAVSLPLWLARDLLDKGLVEVKHPPHLGKKVREEAHADASSVAFGTLSEYYALAGHQVAHMLQDEELRMMVSRAYSGDRYRDLVDAAFSKYVIDFY